MAVPLAARIGGPSTSALGQAVPRTCSKEGDGYAERQPRAAMFPHSEREAHRPDDHARGYQRGGVPDAGVDRGGTPEADQDRGRRSALGSGSAPAAFGARWPQIAWQNE